MKVSKTLLAIAVASTPLMATSVNAVQLEDYLIANSSYDEAYVSGSLTAIEPAGDDPNDQVGYNYSIDADYEKAFSTLPRSWGYRVGLNAGGAKPSAKTTAVTDAAGVTTSVATQSTEDWQANAEGVIDTYFHQSQYPKAFWFGQGAFKHQDSLPDDDISATVGLGYGRVYNATPLAKVIRIVEELNEEGLLTGPIPDSVALETAEIIDRIQEFKSKFGEDDYKPDYYAAIEAALGRSGALRDGKFGALGALTADKVLEDEPISTRKHGWVVRLGAGFQASDLSSFEPVFGDETITKFRNDMSYTHEVTDMIDWINTWSMTYSDGEDANGNALESTNHIVSSRYSFDLGNSIRFESGFNYRLK